MPIIAKTHFGDDLDVTSFAGYVTENPWTLAPDGEKVSIAVDWDELFPEHSDPEFAATCKELTGGAGIPGFAFDAARWLASYCGITDKKYAIFEPDDNHPQSKIIVEGRENIAKMAAKGIDVISMANVPHLDMKAKGPKPS